MAITKIQSESMNLADTYAFTGTVTGAGGGKVLQVVQATKNDVFSTTSTSYVDVTGLSVDITPASTSNKVLVICNIGKSSNSSDGGTMYQLVRGSTSIYDSNTGGNADDAFGTAGGGGMSDNGRKNDYGLMTYIDSPSSTSAQTYKLRMKVTSNTGYINRWAMNNDQSGVTSITLMEIAG